MAIDRLEEQRVWKDLHPKIRRGAMAVMNDVTFKDGKATHNRTGEDVTHMVDVGIKTTHKQVQALKAVDELSALEIENGGFIFAFFKQARMLEERFPSLTKQDTARLMYIGTYVAWETNRLQSDNGKQVYTKKDLEQLVDMSTKRFNEFFKRLESENIVHKNTETGEIFINPTVFYRGELKKHAYDIAELQYTRLFKKTVRDLYKQFKGRTLGQLAVIYSIMPFINFSTNIVAFNPEETAYDLIKPMNLDKLAVLLDYKDSNKLKQALNRIKVNNQPVFGFFEDTRDRRKKRIVVNPRIIFAGNGEQLKAIMALFN